MEEENTLFKFFLHGLAGSIGAILSIFILFPIDNVKLRMQIEAQKNHTSKGIKDHVKQIYENESVKGFYKGIMPTLIGNFISNFTYFFCYNTSKHYIDIQIPNLKYIVCTLIGGLLTSIVTNPFWVIQTQQTVDKKNSGIFQIVRRLGFRGLYKGFSSSLFLVLNPIINYMVYENLKIAGAPYKDTQLGPVIYFIAGGTGKFFATIITYPYQVLRTQSHLQKDATLITMTKEILKNKGITGLYAGLQAKLYQTVLNQAFTLMFYEEILQYSIHFFEHLTDDKILFTFKIIYMFVLCLYVQTHRSAKYSGIFKIFFIGLIASFVSNLILLIDHHEYKTISIGFFAVGLLLYIHSALHNLSKKKDRQYLIYLVGGIFIVFILLFNKFIFIFDTEIHYQYLVGGGCLITFLVLSFMRYGKTSKKSYAFTACGAIFLTLSASLMYHSEHNYYLNKEGKYAICGIQSLALLLLMLGNTTHSTYLHVKEKK